ncbi:MAG TPA: STY0301 family protein [Stellaceae bacterium]|nr:STY0301 family protein [Stellaceae bacterium]
MNRRGHVALICVVALPWSSAAEAAPAHKIQCPAMAPAEWGIRDAPLSGVQILSQPKGEKIDEAAPPSLVPDQTDISGGTLRQFWIMNGSGPGWDFFVDCQYRGTTRILRIEANGVKRCDRTITHYHASGAADKRSVDRLQCD